MSWSIDHNECEYIMKLKVMLRYRQPPENHVEVVEREVLQNNINIHVGKWMSDPKNRQNLMNMILGNTSIII